LKYVKEEGGHYHGNDQATWDQSVVKKGGGVEKKGGAG